MDFLEEFVLEGRRKRRRKGYFLGGCIMFGAAVFFYLLLMVVELSGTGGARVPWYFDLLYDAGGKVLVALLFVYLGVVFVVAGLLPKWVGAVFSCLAVFVALPLGVYGLSEGELRMSDGRMQLRDERVVVEDVPRRDHSGERKFFHSYTLIDGRVIEAKLVGYRDEVVSLRKRDGETMRLPIGVFETESQKAVLRRCGM